MICLFHSVVQYKLVTETFGILQLMKKTCILIERQIFLFMKSAQYNSDFLSKAESIIVKAILAVSL